jgi:hypothetical protein
MKPKTEIILRWIALLAVAATTGACNLTLSADSSGSPQVVYITATRDDGGRDTVSTPTFTPEGTTAEALPTMVAGQELSCVKGPHWVLYAWVAKILEGETVTLLAKAPPEWADYYYVRKGDGTECWAFGGSSVIDGDTTGLPEREAPPLSEVTYTIENRTGLDVDDIFIRGKDEPAWGADRLGSGDIPPGGSFSLTLMAGFYDVQAVDSEGGILYEAYDHPIGAEPSSQVTVLDLQLEFFIENRMGADVCSLAVLMVGAPEWTTLHTAADGAIHNGERVYFTLLAGRYQLAVTLCDGTEVPWLPAFVSPQYTGLILDPSHL